MIKQAFTYGNNEYISGDIVAGRADMIVDMENICFGDNSFDYIVASMVLEHVSDETRALRELKRVLKSGGQAVITLPIVSDMMSYEDKTIVDPEDRVKYYGQKDHVRLYGGDAVQHLASIWNDSAGSDVTIFDPVAEYGKKVCRKYGYHPDIPIFVLKKMES